MDKLEAHFKPKLIIIAERFRFYKRNQESGEKMANYLAELQRLAATCDFKTFLEKALQDKFVCGLSSEGVQRRLLVEAGLMLDKAFEMAQDMEASAVDVKEFHSKPKETETASSNVQKVNTSQRKSSQSACHRCLGTGHSPEICRFKSTHCNKCHKLGHIARVCRSEPSSRPNQRGQNHRTTRRRQPNKSHIVNNVEESESEPDNLRVPVVGVSVPKSYKVPLEINGIQMTMKLDTGAGVSLVSEKTWAEELGEPELSSSDIPLEGYPNRPLRVLEQCQVDVKVHGKEAVLPLIVVGGNGISLFGRNWLQSFKLAKLDGNCKNKQSDEKPL